MSIRLAVAFGSEEKFEFTVEPKATARQIDKTIFMTDLILDRYQPIETAGEGGFGTVIVAWDTRIRRKVAIKCIRLRESYAGPGGETISISKATAKLNDPDSSALTQVIKDKGGKTQSLKGKNDKQVDAAGEHWAEDLPGLAEARTAAMIQDANIVTVFDFELANNTAYIIMEYVEGQTLSQFLEKHGEDLTLDMLTCIFSGIANALIVAHSQNVLHLDIKPDNVLIDNTGKVKVTDFGLATLADEFGYGTADAGTIGYMPPEQMRQQGLDFRTDQWSLGAITYEMLSGTNPFDAKDLKGSLNKILDSELVCPSEYWEDIDPALDDVVFRALDPKREQRFESVAAFSEELLHYLGNPRAGKKQISSIMKADAGVVEDTETTVDDAQSNKSQILEGMTSSLSLKIASRVFAVVMSVIISYGAMSVMSFFGGLSTGLSASFAPNIYAFIAFGVVVVGAAILPVIGVSLSLMLLAAQFIFNSQILNGVIMAILVVLWTVYVLYDDWHISAPANCLATSPACQLFGFECIGPFLSGIFCKPVMALCTSALAAYVCLISDAICTNNFAQWQPWILAAGWVLAAVLISFSFQTKKRALSIAGCVLATCVIIVSICVGNYFDNHMMYWQPQGSQIIAPIIAGIISVILAIFLPNRAQD